jgi:hypothetical protein
MIMEYGHGPHTVLNTRKPHQRHVLLLALHKHLDPRDIAALAKQVHQFGFGTKLPFHVRDMEGVCRWVDRNRFLAAEAEVLLIKHNCLGVLARALAQFIAVGVV